MQIKKKKRSNAWKLVKQEPTYLRQMDNDCLFNKAVDHKFNAASMARHYGCTRQAVSQLLDSRFGKALVEQARNECKKKAAFKALLKKQSKYILALANQKPDEKKHHTKMYDNLMGYMDSVGKYFSDTFYSNCGLYINPEQSKKFIYKQLQILRTNSYNRIVRNRSGKYTYPDYWMLLTPLQFAVMFTNNPDIERLQAFMNGSSKSKKDVSRFDHQIGKNISNCAFQSLRLNRSESKTRTHLKRQISKQLAWRDQMIVLKHSNVAGFNKAFIEAQREAIEGVGQQYFNFLLSKPNSEFSILDCIAIVRFRPNQNKFYKFKSSDFDLGRLDHTQCYSIDNVGMQKVAANRSEAQARKNLRGYIEGNLSVLSTLLSTDNELRKAEFCAGLLTWMHQAQHYKVISDVSVYEVIANKVAWLNSQAFKELTQEQKFEIKNHIAFEEGVSKFFDERVPSLVPYEQLTVQGLLMPSMSIEDLYIDQRGSSFAECAAKKIINSLKVHHYAPADMVRQLLPLVVNGLVNEGDASPIIDAIEAQLATMTKRYSVEEVL